MNARRASDQATSLHAGEERSGKDRRAGDRRAPQRSFDPLFTVTLVNQIAPPETEYVRGYVIKVPVVRRGFIVNARA